MTYMFPYNHDLWIIDLFSQEGIRELDGIPNLYIGLVVCYHENIL